MCDFCGSFTDIDFAVGIETWTEDKGTTLLYQARKIELTQRSQAALALGDRTKYAELQHEFWDLYYKTFPAYLPPTIDTADKYSLYLKVCVVSSVESGFDAKWQQYAKQQHDLQNAVRYLTYNGQTKAESKSFFLLADFFRSIMKEGMREFYEDPRYSIMHELLPETVHLKMKTSMFVQAWLPYLLDDDTNTLLKMFGFSNEYEEIEMPSGENIRCETCRTALFAPDGSYRVFCEKCRRSTNVRSRFFCMSCGSPNSVPEDPSKPVECIQCGIANRIIRPYFGQ